MVDATVVAVNRGGAMCTVMGLRAFMPGSHYLPGKNPPEEVVDTTLKVRTATTCTTTATCTPPSTWHMPPSTWHTTPIHAPVHVSQVKFLDVDKEQNRLVISHRKAMVDATIKDLTVTRRPHPRSGFLLFCFVSAIIICLLMLFFAGEVVVGDVGGVG